MHDMPNGKTATKIIELTVRNHPGVMSHITGLFSRRCFNLEGIICTPVGDGSISRMFLSVNEGPRLEQVVRQLEKLYDVLEVKQRSDESLKNILHEAWTSCPA